jgi:hypothetical protein
MLAMGRLEATYWEVEKTVPQARRTLIDDKGRYRQIQREPDGHYVQYDRHAH